MDNDLIKSLTTELQKLEFMQGKTCERLAELESFSNTYLDRHPVKGRYYYSSKKREDSCGTYLGGEKNSDVQKIKEYRYLKQLRDDLDSEICLIRQVLSSHRSIDYESVASRLPKTYQGSITISLPSRSEKAAEWIASKKMEKARYPVKRPEELTMTAIDGTNLRSKSEMNIANLLILNGIPYVYELPHVINGILTYSDFTTLSIKDYETEIIFEHEGLMNDLNYQQMFLSKVNNYLAEGLVPNIDVFFTFDDLRGGFDTSAIQNIIDTRLK